MAVISAFPLIKLATLGLIQASRPIGNKIKKLAINNRTFRKYICIPPAQFYNKIEVILKMWSLNLGTPVKIPPLSEAAAIELGASLIGELVVFSVCVFATALELTRRSTKKSRKQTAHETHHRTMKETVQDYILWMDRQDAQLQEISNVLKKIKEEQQTKKS